MTQSRKRLAHVVLTTVAICVGVFAATAPAQAGVGLSITPDIVSNPAVVGQANIPANLRIANASNGTDAAGSATLSRIQLTMACGDQGNSLGNCAQPDPGVFQPSSIAHGVGGSCAAMNFHVAPDPVGGVAAGRYLFAATDESVTLGPPGSGTDVCEIAFTVDVLKVPTIDGRPASPGVQTFTPAYADGVLVVPGNPNGLDINGRGIDETRIDPQPVIQVVKTVAPGTRPAPGGNFTFTLVLSNPGPTALTLTTLTDSVYGDLFIPENLDVSNNTCDDLIGAVLPAAPSDSLSCSFVGQFTGPAGATETDTATVEGTDENGNQASDVDDAVVQLTASAQIHVVKTASPAARPEPGGAFTFTLVVSNPGEVAIVITSLVDDIYGNLGSSGNPQVSNNTCDDLIGSTLEPETGVSCAFVGQFTGAAGDTETDIATVVVVDANGNSASDDDDAIVRLTPPTDGADFNGDGFADLAVGVPDEDVGAVANAGAVNVIYGNAAGLTGTASQLWHQNSASVSDSGGGR